MSRSSRRSVPLNVTSRPRNEAGWPKSSVKLTGWAAASRAAASAERSVSQVWTQAGSSSWRKKASSRTRASRSGDADRSKTSAANGAGSGSMSTASPSGRAPRTASSRVSICRGAGGPPRGNQACSIQPSTRRASRAAGMNRQKTRRRSAGAR
ncbi:MAG: hypothetical protein ACKOC4_07130 [Planctomycetia bacterium]